MICVSKQMYFILAFDILEAFCWLFSDMAEEDDGKEYRWETGYEKTW